MHKITPLRKFSLFFKFSLDFLVNVSPVQNKEKVMAAVNPSSHILTQGGYIKDPLKIVNTEGEKIRLYHLPNTEQKT